MAENKFPPYIVKQYYYYFYITSYNLSQKEKKIWHVLEINPEFDRPLVNEYNCCPTKLRIANFLPWLADDVIKYLAIFGPCFIETLFYFSEVWIITFATFVLRWGKWNLARNLMSRNGETEFKTMFICQYYFYLFNNYVKGLICLTCVFMPINYWIQFFYYYLNL